MVISSFGCLVFFLLRAPTSDGKKIGCSCACGRARWSCPFSSLLKAPTEIKGTPLPFETWKSFFLHHNFIRRFECEYEMLLCHTGADNYCNLHVQGTKLHDETISQFPTVLFVCKPVPHCHTFPLFSLTFIYTIPKFSSIFLH